MSPRERAAAALYLAATGGPAPPAGKIRSHLRGALYTAGVVSILATSATTAAAAAVRPGPPAETPAELNRPLDAAAQAVAPETVSTPDPVPSRRLYDADLRPLTFSDEQIVDFLATAEVVRIEPIDESTRTRPDKLLLSRDGQRLHAIFHSFDQAERHVMLGDLRVDDFLDSYRNQVAAYELSRLLDMDNVPPATLRTLRDVPGAVSLWLEDSLTWTNWEANHNPAPGHGEDSVSAESSWERRRDDMRVFDALINNLDRHGSNIMIDSQLKLWLVDHTRTFVHDPQLAATALGIERCSTQMWVRLQQLDHRTLRRTLSPYLGREELKGLLQRRRQLVKLLRRAISDHGAESVLFDFETDPPAAKR